ncbi:uncharacterized protein LACBIDRAFT_315486 [Laccaria bicolor S238N-H82]|uniref:Predicted protein n=1 Tax=Laccaria bicolor (strain S238N-H82 / ATCC MYA-4686) TaxID=486041 RepID=B0D2I1_LACBS|nr:uncharacterized protein LACBIDRAFT_315486 [Laccaria bicolor S238N-H82]EDR10754.1 predicted protein [Laccaria bicolor S238N-H82]|eukprot:XP_001878055.1 predicted protein [Laccaria bicolor S238N-H82]
MLWGWDKDRYESMSHTFRLPSLALPITLPGNDPTPDRRSQLPWAPFPSLPDLRSGLLKPDTVRGISLDVDQYQAFGMPRNRLHKDISTANLPVLTEREILRNLPIVVDADRPETAPGARRFVK